LEGLGFGVGHGRSFEGIKLNMFNLADRPLFEKDTRPVPHRGPVSSAAVTLLRQLFRAYLRASKIVSSWYW